MSKLGGDEIISTFQRRMENATEEKFVQIEKENSEKRKIFDVGNFDGFFLFKLA